MKYIHYPIYYRDQDHNWMGGVQKCKCGELIRRLDLGADYTVARKACPKCGVLNVLGEVVMTDRFSGLDMIFMEHRLHGVKGYEHAPLPTFNGDPDSIAADILSRDDDTPWDDY